MSKPQSPSPLKDGDFIELNGQKHRLVVMQPGDICFEPPAGLPPSDLEAFKHCLSRLEAVSLTVQRISDRLLDREDGLTHEGIRALTEHRACLDPAFFGRLQGYLLGILKHGDTLHGMRGCVMVPPCTRKELESELKALPSSVLGQLDWNRFADHLYDSTPRITQGFYRFASAADEQRFFTSLGTDIQTKVQEIESLFQRQLTTGLSRDEWKRYDTLSQEVLEAQKHALEEKLQRDAEASALSTRATISVDAKGEPTFSAVHYTVAFANELAQLRDQLIAARDCLPAWATELRSVLTSQADWCVDTKRSPEWGQSLPAWIAAKDSANVLDVNVTAEEKVSHLGSKGNFHLLVTQHAAVPDELAGVWASVQAAGSASNINTLMLRTLMVGGGTSYMLYAGEKLPDPAGQPSYKSMTFKNTTQVLMIMSQVDAVMAATGMTRAEVLAMKDTPVLGVTLHEYGHTLGDHAAFLGAHAGSAEETNAQGSAVYLAARLAPSGLEDLLRFETCWMPVRRVQQGPTESHSRSDIALFDEYERAGAVEIATGPANNPFVRVKDSGKAVTTAFDTAIKMRLWEKGLPERLHARFSEPFNASDGSQDQRIIAGAMAFLGSSPDRAALAKEAVDEVNRYFDNGRLLKISERLHPVLAQIPASQPLSIIASDPRIAAIVQ